MKCLVAIFIACVASLLSAVPENVEGQSYAASYSSYYPTPLDSAGLKVQSPPNYYLGPPGRFVDIPDLKDRKDRFDRFERKYKGKNSVLYQAIFGNYGNKDDYRKGDEVNQLENSLKEIFGQVMYVGAKYDLLRAVMDTIFDCFAVSNDGNIISIASTKSSCGKSIFLSEIQTRDATGRHPVVLRSLFKDLEF